MISSNPVNDIKGLPAITSLSFRDDYMDVSLSDGRILSMPLAWYPRLSNAKLSQLKNFEISPGGYGVHWPDLDEDLSVKGFLFP